MALIPQKLGSVYSADEVRRYLQATRFPGFENAKDDTVKLPEPTLRTLSLLHIHHLTTFAFESLAMNYEPNGAMKLEPDYIFHRFVKEGCGGYCFQNNYLFQQILRALGYKTFPALGRVALPPSEDGNERFTGLAHMVNLVCLPSHQKQESKLVYYLVDVGYGAGIHRPMLLRDGHTEKGRGEDLFRLVKTFQQPRSSLEHTVEEVDQEVLAVANSQWVWKLQNKNADQEEWRDCYVFGTLECFSEDFAAGNKATSSAKSDPFAIMILVIKYNFDEDRMKQSDELLAKDGLDPELYPYHPSCVIQKMLIAEKYTVKSGLTDSKTETLDSELARIKVLKQDFGLLPNTSDDEALQEIKGKPSALKPST